MDEAILLDASRVLGASSDGETVVRALEFVLQVGEVLQGLTARPDPQCRDHRTGKEADLCHPSGYRERLLARLPAWSCAGVPIRTALAAGGADALLAEVTMLHLLLERRDVELAARHREVERCADDLLCAKQRIRMLEERVEVLERARAGLRTELRNAPERRWRPEGRDTCVVHATPEATEHIR